MGLSASQGRLLLLTAKKSDLEFRAQQIAMLRAILCQQQEAASKEYEAATSNRIMSINLLATIGGTAADDKTTVNLTYQNLISGTVGLPPSLAGIQASEKAHTNYYEYSSAQKYRMTTPDGAIVVSHISEIPTNTVATENTPTKSDGDNKKNFGEKGGGFWEITNEKLDGSKDISYGFVAPNDSELAKLLEGGAKSLSGFEIDTKNGWVKYENEDGKDEFYNLADGKKAEKLPDNLAFSSKYPVTLYETQDDVPCSYKEKLDEKSTRKLSEVGPDGICTLYENDIPIQRYLIDSNLAKNYMDTESGISDINYLQECLRNGKYMLQRCVEDENVKEGWRWSDISWDTATNVTDSYYTEDDAAAKAKYDRIQNEIQAQDKKLELELDNIETQRSAVTTEMDSVKKVIDENIEGSFNAFG